MMILLNAPLPPEYLDALLAMGWYRMRQHVFTTNFLWLDDAEPVPVWWVRLWLENFRPTHRYNKLARLCKPFSCTLQDAIVTDEIETLYATYRAGIDFDAGDTAHSFLLDERNENYFPARMWQLRDSGRLIAVGYFDEGLESAAGILNFYDPAYKKYSPGLFLYLESVRYAASLGKQFFYPGYIALGNTKFDYKLLAGTAITELWNADLCIWEPYQSSLHARHFNSGSY